MCIMSSQDKKFEKDKNNHPANLINIDSNNSNYLAYYIMKDPIDLDKQNIEEIHKDMQKEIDWIKAQNIRQNNLQNNKTNIEKQSEEGIWDKAKHIITDVKNTILGSAEKVGETLKEMIYSKPDNSDNQLKDGTLDEKVEPLNTNLNTNRDINMNLKFGQKEAIVDNKDFQEGHIYQKRWDVPSDIKDINKEIFPKFTGEVTEIIPMIPDKHHQNM
jgi:hypothetical protein